MGTPDLGTAAAGRAALAKDAATIFGNPAGMTNLDSSQLLIGAQLVVGDVRFATAARTRRSPAATAATLPGRCRSAASTTREADLAVERGPLANRVQGGYKSYNFHIFALNLSWLL